MRRLSLPTLFLSLATFAPAQENGITVGLGRETFDVTVNGFTAGIAHVAATEELWVSSIVSGQNHMQVLDARTRAHKRTITWPFPGQLLADGASDGFRTIWGSSTGDLQVFEPDGTRPFSTFLQTASGPRPVVNPIPTPGIGGSVVAFDPGGNGGLGSLWVNDRNDLQEIDLSGGLLRTLPNAVNSPRLGGIAYDETSDTLWCAVDDDGCVFQVDVATGARTGVRFRARTPNSSGELDWIDGNLSEGRPCGRDLVFTQGPRVTAHRVDLADGHPFANEPKLLVGTDGMATTAGVVPIDPLRSGLAFDLDRPGIPYAVFFNFEPESLMTRPVGPLFGLFPETWEFRRIFVPAITSVTTTSGLPFTAPASWYVGNWPGGQQIRVQAVYIDPSITGCGSYLPLGVTNEAGWDWSGAGVVVRASGGDSSVMQSEPFWTIEATPQLTSSIRRLKFDFSVSANPAHAPYWFRQYHFFATSPGWTHFVLGRGDRGAGQCGGTYRGSDATCGLDYGWSGINFDMFCNGTTYTAGARRDPADKTMEWRFVPNGFTAGDSFTFDLRVYPGSWTTPVAGDDLAGLVVTVELADGRVATAPLVAEGRDTSVAWFPF